MKPLALLGGTFDPVHLGHLNLAWEASELLDAEVRLVPARIPPHRAQPTASAAERIALLQAALAGQNRLAMDTRELEREGPSYTTDTLRSLREEFPKRSLIWLIGVDAFNQLASWHQWRQLFQFAHIAVVNRPGVAINPVGRDLAHEWKTRCVSELSMLHRQHAGCIMALTTTPLAISATRIRQLLASGRKPRFLLPQSLFAQAQLLTPYQSGSVEE